MGSFCGWGWRRVQNLKGKIINKNKSIQIEVMRLLFNFSLFICSHFFSLHNTILAERTNPEYYFRVAAGHSLGHNVPMTTLGLVMREKSLLK